MFCGRGDVVRDLRCRGDGEPEHWMCAWSSSSRRLTVRSHRPDDRQTDRQGGFKTNKQGKNYKKKTTTNKNNAECQSWDLLHSHYTFEKKKRVLLLLLVVNRIYMFVFVFFVFFPVLLRICKKENFAEKILLHFVKWEQTRPPENLLGYFFVFIFTPSLSLAHSAL